jgi:UDP:flavonoid glycosyltransferase YjiC (YdhE family)
MVAGSIFDTLHYITKESPKIYAKVQVSSWQACQNAENLIYSILSPWGYDIAEALGIQSVPGALHPIHPTKAFPTQLFPKNLSPTINLISHYLAEWLLWQIMRRSSRVFRQKKLELKPFSYGHTLFRELRDKHTPLLCALSPSIISRPTDWPEYIQMEGYWFLDAPASWKPSPELVNFLQNGDKPVYIGFGSMANQRARQMTEIVIEALHISGQRGVLARGWGGLNVSDPPENIFLLDEVPHDWLFPQMTAVVHHGGAGTTAAGLRAGVPSIVIPHMQDQPYWGRRIFELGVGPSPIPRKRLNAVNLAQAITQAVKDQNIREKSRRIGEKICLEDGVGRAADFIEAYMFT